MKEIPSLIPNVSGFDTSLEDKRISALDYLSWFKKQFDKQLALFFQQKRQEAKDVSTETLELLDQIISFSENGGKRVRPAFMYSGYVASGGQAHSAALFASLSVELLHTFALIHDDIMDNSDLRRGAATVHKVFEELHRKKGLKGDPRSFGLSSAILAGDLAYSFAEEILTTAPFPQERVRRARYFFDQMKTQVIYGQYLDVLGGYKDEITQDEALKILEFKTAKYTVERPLHLGAMLAGADYEILETFTRYGIPFGQAFQIQDDILGTFGDPKDIGKPTDSDLKEGKKTLLLVKALELGNRQQRSILKSVAGNKNASEEEIDRARFIIKETGAYDYCVKLSRQLLRTAKDTVWSAKLKTEGKAYLISAADYLLQRI